VEFRLAVRGYQPVEDLGAEGGGEVDTSPSFSPWVNGSVAASWAEAAALSSSPARFLQILHESGRGQPGDLLHLAAAGHLYRVGLVAVREGRRG